MPKKDIHKKVCDIISIGDATLDTFIMLEEATVQCSLKRDHCLLCLSYADKTAIPHPVKTIGGNAANNAVGSARLGLKTAIYTVIGDDDNGHKVVRALNEAGVSTEYANLQKGGETNSAFILNYQTERTILVYHADRTYKLPKFKETSWIYLTSMGRNHRGIHREVLHYLSKHDVKLAFNPGTHQLKEGLKKLRPILDQTDILFVNKEEAMRLVGEISDIKKLLAAMHRVGPSVVVITDGEQGSYAHDGHRYWRIGVTNTPVLERTGAGDAFATGFLAATHYGKTIPEALRWGTMNSASVITKVGPEAGLLTKSQMATWLGKHRAPRAELF